MKCLNLNCNTDNPDDAKYCRVCGNILRLDSPLERFPELRLIPVTMIELKSSLGASFLLYLLEIPFVIGCFMFIGGIIAFFVESALSNVLTAVCGFICSFIIAYISFKYRLFDKSFPNRYIKGKLLEEADYIQHDIVNNSDYVFILKNNKFGVYSVKRYEVLLPTNYDRLSWKVEGKILDAQQNGRQFIIDIYGNELK